ncbi:MAG: hypothetical protein JWP12_1592 [Bacteroidetes bacterium]|nr:hypothetical protein [Bacteroidota bacterium]
MFDITIEMGEDAKAESPQIISSGGMGPCISVAISDPIGKCGYMRHQSNPENDNDLEDFIIKSLAECSNVNIVKVYAAGGAEGEDADHVLDSRKYVLELLSKYFIKSQIKIKWSKHEGVAELVLDTGKGKFKVRDCDKPPQKKDSELDTDEIWANL